MRAPHLPLLRSSIAGALRSTGFSCGRLYTVGDVSGAVSCPQLRQTVQSVLSVVMSSSCLLLGAFRPNSVASTAPSCRRAPGQSYTALMAVLELRSCVLGMLGESSDCIQGAAYGSQADSEGSASCAGASADGPQYTPCQSLR